MPAEKPGTNFGYEPPAPESSEKPFDPNATQETEIYDPEKTERATPKFVAGQRVNVARNNTNQLEYDWTVEKYTESGLVKVYKTVPRDAQGRDRLTKEVSETDLASWQKFQKIS